MCALIDRENARPRNCNPDTSRRSSNQKSLTPPSGSHVYSDAPSVCSLHACTLPLEALNVIPDRLNRLVMEAGTIWGWQAERQRGCWLVIGALLVAIVPLRYCPGQRARRDQAKMSLQLFSLDALRNSRRWRCTPPPLISSFVALSAHTPRSNGPARGPCTTCRTARRTQRSAWTRRLLPPRALLAAWAPRKRPAAQNRRRSPRTSQAWPGQHQRPGRAVHTASSRPAPLAGRGGFFGPSISLPRQMLAGEGAEAAAYTRKLGGGQTLHFWQTRAPASHVLGCASGSIAGPPLPCRPQMVLGLACGTYALSPFLTPSLPLFHAPVSSRARHGPGAKDGG